MDYVKMLKEIMRTTKWTQEQLGARLGVSFATVNSWINGKSRPRDAMMGGIKQLYLAQDVTGELEPVFITIVRADDVLRVGDTVLLERDMSNIYDDEAVRAIREDDYGAEEYDERNIGSDAACSDDDECNDDCSQLGLIKIGDCRHNRESAGMYVANSIGTVARGTWSAGRIYDKIDNVAQARVMFVVRGIAIAKVMNWSYDAGEIDG